MGGARLASRRPAVAAAAGGAAAPPAKTRASPGPRRLLLQLRGEQLPAQLRSLARRHLVAPLPGLFRTLAAPAAPACPAAAAWPPGSPVVQEGPCWRLWLRRECSHPQLHWAAAAIHSSHSYPRRWAAPQQQGKPCSHLQREEVAPVWQRLQPLQASQKPGRVIYLAQRGPGIRQGMAGCCDEGYDGTCGRWCASQQLLVEQALSHWQPWEPCAAKHTRQNSALSGTVGTHLRAATASDRRRKNSTPSSLSFSTLRLTCGQGRGHFASVARAGEHGVAACSAPAVPQLGGLTMGA